MKEKKEDKIVDLVTRKKIDLNTLSKKEIEKKDMLSSLFRATDGTRDKDGKSYAQVAIKKLFPQYTLHEFVELNKAMLLLEAKANPDRPLRNESLAKAGLLKLIEHLEPTFGEKLFEAYQNRTSNEQFWDKAFNLIPPEVKSIFQKVFSEKTDLPASTQSRGEYVMFAVKGALNEAAEKKLQSKMEKAVFGMELQANMDSKNDAGYQKFLTDTVHENIVHPTFSEDTDTESAEISPRNSAVKELKEIGIRSATLPRKLVSEEKKILGELGKLLEHMSEREKAMEKELKKQEAQVKEGLAPKEEIKKMPSTPTIPRPRH